MKRIKLAVIILMSSFTANVLAQTTPTEANADAPIMTFVKTTHDFGTLHEGDQVETDYEFTNTGKSALLITRIKASCGCTVPSGWTKEPILPGESSKFTVHFNTRGKPNKQHKSVTVTCNTAKGKEVVRFTANVIPDPQMQKMREERAAQRKIQYEKRKLEQQKKEAAIKSAKEVKEKKVIVKKEIVKPKDAKEIEKEIKELKKSEKELKKANKEAKKITKASKAVNITKKKLNKLQAKFLKTETKGDLSPNEKLKFEKKIGKLKEKLQKQERKLLKLKK